MPFTDPKKACAFVLENCPQIPFWPQLPKKDFKENMYVMFSEHLPGVVLESERIFLDSSCMADIEAFYSKLLENPQMDFPISDDYASALHEFLANDFRTKQLLAVKGQVTGPISFGLQVSDEHGKPVLYNELLSDVIVKNIAGIIRWQEKVLTQLSSDTLIFIDEPYMSMIGSTIVSLNPEKVRSMMNELALAAKGKIGLHCCANTDWSLVLGTEIDIISFDAYEYANNFLLYQKEIAQFLDRGGSIAWGIVPNSPKDVASETVESLFSRFESLLSQLEERTDISRERLLESSLITPACGLGARDFETNSKTFALTSALSMKIRREYSLR